MMSVLQVVRVNERIILHQKEEQFPCKFWSTRGLPVFDIGIFCIVRTNNRVICLCTSLEGSLFTSKTATGIELRFFMKKQQMKNL